MSPLRVAFAGRSGSGKTLAVRLLAARLLASRKRVVCLNFADPLYAIVGGVQRGAGLPVQKDREMLQTIGSLLRARDEATFVRMLLDRLEASVEESPDTTSVLVGDVRYPNEYEALRSRGFKMVKIVRPNSPQGPSETWRRHSSETSLNDNMAWDAVVINEGHDQIQFETALINAINS